MTDKPTHRPMSRADWDATNDHARAMLHPARDVGPNGLNLSELRKWMHVPTEDESKDYTQALVYLSDLLHEYDSLKAELDSVGRAYWREQQASVDASAVAASRLRIIEQLQGRVALTDKERHEIEQTRRAVGGYRAIVQRSGIAGPQGRDAVDLDYLQTYLSGQAFMLLAVVDRLTSPDPRADGDA